MDDERTTQQQGQASEPSSTPPQDRSEANQTKEAEPTSAINPGEQVEPQIGTGSETASSETASESENEHERESDPEGDGTDSVAEVAPEKTDAASEGATTAEKNSQHAKTKKIALIAAAVIALCLIGFAGYRAWQQQQEAAAREKVFSDYLDLQYETYGWPEDSVTYEDSGKGNVVEVTYRTDTSAVEAVDYGMLLDPESSQDEAQELADDLDSIVFIFGYTSDDYLLEGYVALPDDQSEITDEGIEAAKDLLQEKYDENAENAEQAEAWFGEWRSYIIENYEGTAEVMQDYYEGSSMISIFLQPEYTSYFSNDEEQQAFDASWQVSAFYLSRIFGTRTIIGFVNTGTGETENVYGTEFSEDAFIYNGVPEELQ